MSSRSNAAQYVGPYRLEKTLGKGQTGLVKMGVHCTTGKKVAIKVINREKLNENIINKVEREISIMKLIDHPHILRLYDVYENKKYLYLILELVSGGELFDYLVKRGRLTLKEARHFFRQIVSAVDFCHNHNVCHRDLKPENLLLDEDKNIKVADFGMASLQPEGYLLETSCGSPHYACPEVIRGDKYDGRIADVWSCGVVLFALIVGALPFDDDNLRQLLEKVKSGVFYIPRFVHPDVQNLLRGMIEVRPEKRMTLQQVLKHKFMTGPNTNGLDVDTVKAFSTAPMDCFPISSENNADPDVLLSMSSLGCFSEREKLLDNLMSDKPNTEKIVYHMLLRRKLKHPSFDDDASSLPCKHPDAPRKRVDSTSSQSSLSSSVDDVRAVGGRTLSSASLSSIGCRGSRRKLSAEALNSGERPSSMSRRGENSAHPRSRSLTTAADSRMRSSGSNSSTKYDTNCSNQSQVNTASNRGNPDSSTTVSSLLSSQWRQRFTNFKNSFLGSPRFHRRKMQAPSTEDINNSSSHLSPSMELTKRSWFDQFMNNSSSSMNACDRDDAPLILLMNKRNLNCVKAELVHTFLSVSERPSLQDIFTSEMFHSLEIFIKFLEKISNLTHSITAPTRFTCEYRTQKSHSHSVFHNRAVKFRVDIHRANSPARDVDNQKRDNSVGDYHVTFHLTSGPNRRFKRVLELIQIQLQAENYVPQSQPEGDISAYSRELQQFCTSAAKSHNDSTANKNKRK